MKRIEQLRPWQVEAFQLLRPAQYGQCQAPGGSGKSLEQVMLGQADIDDTGNKQLILVPQNHIHHSFFGDENLEFTLPDNVQVSRWSIAENLCDKRPETGKRLREFLLEDVRTLRKDGRLTAISTHKAMVSAWKRLMDIERNEQTEAKSTMIDGKRFRCPRCGGHTVREYLGGAVVRCDILSIERDEDGDLCCADQTKSIIDHLGGAWEPDYECAECGLELDFDKLATMVAEEDCHEES